MSSRHLLNCSCGTPIPVAASQAGGSVTCGECGSTQTVPRLRDLRALPVEAEAQPAGPSWGFRQGVLTAGLLLATALAGGAAWFSANEPAPPPEFNAEVRNELIGKDLGKMSPVELWALYQFRYAPMTTNGMEVQKNPNEKFLEMAIGRNRFFRDALLYAAGGVLVASVLAFALVRS